MKKTPFSDVFILIADPRVHDHSATRLLSRIAESRVHKFALGTHRSVIPSPAQPVQIN